jgi:hypothetical protein
MRRRSLLQALMLLPWVTGALPGRALAQGATLTTLAVTRDDGALLLEFAVRLALPRTVEDALQRGVPVYFVAESTIYRRRWYWRDERVARVRRTWRLAFQPLTSTWRVSLGALGQSHATLPEALSAVSASGQWRVAETAQLEPGETHYLHFEYELDSRQLPSPMQIDLGGRGDWALHVERDLALPP